jgi:S1-C subfamily serine protease
MKLSFKKIVIIIALGLFAFATYLEFTKNGAINLFPTNFESPNNSQSSNNSSSKVVIKSEESVVIDVVEQALPSVVTIGIKFTRRSSDRMEIDPFDPFSPFRRIPGNERTIERNIGSGFIVSEDGIVITNKHVVNETDAEYTVITNDKQVYIVSKIYRDPLNDLAILKVNTTGLKPLILGDSSKLKLGQKAIAIGTPLGEFQNTITTGIVSGLGRGITAGSMYEGFVERLDSVIQTDAAISAGNSGGPLLNSSAEVIGVNTAVSSQGENIGFAIPVNVVKELLNNFEARGGSFERPYIGIRFSMIDQEIAQQEDLVEGAFIQSVEEGSPAERAGLKRGDIITAIDNIKLQGSDNNSLAKAIVQKKVGDKISIEFFREGKKQKVEVILASF